MAEPIRGRAGKIRKVATFGVVGILATAVHFSVGLTLAETGIARPIWANFYAFVAAFLVSYVGHHRFTFKSNAEHRHAAPRFLVIALGGLLLNQLIVYAMVDQLAFRYIQALFVVLLVAPLLTFLLGQVWAFRSTRNAVGPLGKD